jgi:hypothetical protein
MGTLSTNQTAMRRTWRTTLAETRRRIRRFVLEDRVTDHLGGPPNNFHSTGYIMEHRMVNEGKLHTHEVIAHFNADASQVLVGDRFTAKGMTEKHVEESWRWFVSTATFRRLALWYLWRWAWGEWFGLRRRLYYWDLRRRCREATGQYDQSTTDGNEED